MERKERGEFLLSGIKSEIMQRPGGKKCLRGHIMAKGSV